MKNLILFTLIVIFCNSTFAQNKVERYCQVQIVPKRFSIETETVSISFGKEETLFSFKDTSVISNLKKVNALKTPTDVLNFMSNLGWSIISIIPFGEYTLSERMYFKKEFDLSELTGTK